MKYSKTLARSANTMEVVSGEERKIVKVLSFPKNQSDVFDLLTQGLSMSEAEDEYLKRCRAVQDRLDLLMKSDHLAKYEEYEVKKIPGATGWQIEILMPYRMSLAEFEKYHTFSSKEERQMIESLCAALKEAKKAQLDAGPLKKENVFLTKEGSYVLDVFNELEKEDAGAYESLEKLVADEELKNEIRTKDLWGW
ncbi:hypothetical protein [uncultured Dubosiella sp.]|uniref:hypothetical protein n=1 Tax=uncultured Dubosiella sp. TaxID=1937011 RepID=UPI002608A0A1|nr:hypothetical protein [uncultured Dubosiella sp.]